VRAALAAGSVFALALPMTVSAADDLGRKLFTQSADPPCAVCHTLKAAGATGNVGPSLDELKPDKARVLAVLRTGSGVMPRFADALSEQEMDAVAEFVSKAVSGN
jgi:cytochrome c6